MKNNLVIVYFIERDNGCIKVYKNGIRSKKRTL